MRKAITARYGKVQKSNKPTVQGKSEVKYIIAKAMTVVQGNDKKAIKTTLQRKIESKKPYYELK